MKNGQCIFGRKSAKILALFCIVLLLSCAAGGTLAYLSTRTASVENSFKKAVVTCQVNANNDGTIDVTNTGNVDAFIRATYTVNWADGSGNVLATAPTSADYTLSLNTSSWTNGSDNFYYHKTRVKPGNVTDDLVRSVVGLKGPPVAGYSLRVDVVAEAIQADGTNAGNTAAYKDAWNGAPSLS